MQKKITKKSVLGSDTICEISFLHKPSKRNKKQQREALSIKQRPLTTTTCFIN
jgi:hypothetical protein